MSADPTPTVVLGFDALDSRHLERFEDDLPNFARLREAGVGAPLRSSFPPWTGSAWPSMYTGVGPDHHGVYDFLAYGDRYPDDAAVVSRNDVRAPALWNYLTAVDVPSVVLNVPVTHPAEPINGVVIPGYLAPEDAAGSPAGVRDDLSAAIGEPYRIYSSTEMADDAERKLEGYLELIRMRAAAAGELLSAHEWGLAFVQVQKTDAVFHNFDDEAAFRAVYAAADDVVGTVLDAVDDANVVVCSDHGIGPTDGYKLYLNEVLRRHGFVEATRAPTRATLASRKAALVEGHEGGGSAAGDGDADGGDGRRTPLAARATSSALSIADAVGVSPGDVYALAERLGVSETLRAMLPESVTASVDRGVDWRRSRAYCRSGSELGVRVNLEGREPEGVVPPDEYEQVRSELVDLLSSLRTPDGAPAFEFVRRREAVYDGPMAGDACDVVFAPADMNNTVATNLMGRAFVPVDTYDHDWQGVFVATGPSFASTADPGALSLLDVAPIVMAAMGLDVPGRMDGSVPADLLSGPSARAPYPDVDYGTADRAAAESDDGEVTARLEDLGYL